MYFPSLLNSALLMFQCSQCHFLRELPEDLKDLRRLRNLDIEGCLNLTHMPRGINKLSSLERLPRFVVGQNNRIGGLEEINGPNKLTGHLEILYLERLKFHASSSKCLAQEKHLKRLTLRWNQGVTHRDDEESLAVLEPHPNLSVLHVVGYKGGAFASWLPSL